MKPFILALDLGTTGNRAIVFDREQKIIFKAYEEFTQIYPNPGWVEHDAEEIWKSVRVILAKTFKKVSPDKIEAIGITNQRETVVVWDKKTGKPVYNAIVWQCRRTAEFCKQLKKRGLEKKIHQKTGLFLDAYFSASKINWILQHVKGVRQKALSGAVIAGTIDTWIIWKLTGGKSHVTDTSNASRTMLLNIHNKKWDSELCRLFEVPEKMLATVVPSSALCGVTDKKIFGREIPITGVVGDQQAASFAQGCFSPSVIKNTYGTGLFVVENTGKHPRFSKNLLTTIAWSIQTISKTDYAVEGSVFIGGAAIQWLRDGLGIIGKASDTEKLVKNLPSNDHVYFVPALVGLGAPYWDPDARGVIIGITRGTTRATIVRAALEAIAYETRDILEVMKKDTKTPFKILRVDGGATANNFLMQFQADILGIPVERPVILETTALGAAGLAGLAVGFWESKEAFNKKRKIDRIFYPKKKTDKDALYAKWKEAVSRARGWVGVFLLASTVCFADESIAGKRALSDSIYEAEQSFNNREYDEAIRINEELLGKVQNNYDKAAILMTLSSAYLEKGTTDLEKTLSDPYYSKALRYAKECYDLDPTAWRALANQGVLYMNTGKLALADTAFSDAERIADENSPYFAKMMEYHSYVKASLNEGGEPSAQ